MFDVFISYAHEDKDYAEDLLAQLTALGLNVWYDELQLEIGDSISHKLGQAINLSNFGVLLISNNSLLKQWTTTEMKLFFQLQLMDKKKKILPIWHNIEVEAIRETFPFLMDVKALRTNIFSIEIIANAIYKVAKGVETSIKPILNVSVQENASEISHESITQNNSTNQKPSSSQKSLKRTNFKRTLHRTIFSG